MGFIQGFLLSHLLFVVVTYPLLVMLSNLTIEDDLVRSHLLSRRQLITKFVSWCRDVVSLKVESG